MFKKKPRQYDDPRDTHGFYEQFNAPMDIEDALGLMAGFVFFVAIAVVLIWALFY